MSPHIRALIFDLDGVITDTVEYHYRSWKRLAEEEGLPFTRADNAALRSVSRRESLNRLLKGRVVDEATAQAWMARKQEYFISYLQMMTPADVLPGVRDLIDDAHASGLKTAIASSSRNARVVLAKLELTDQFEVICDAHCVVHTKPAPDLFLWTAGRLDVYPQHGLVIEDAEAGVTAARAGGFWVVGLGDEGVEQAHVRLPNLVDAQVANLLDQLH